MIHVISRSKLARSQHGLVAEASTIGFPPSYWPRQVMVVDGGGNAIVYQYTDSTYAAGDLVACTYAAITHAPNGEDQLTVLND